jgi:hypothetical protein
MTLIRRRLPIAVLGAVITVVVAGLQFRSVASAQNATTPGMLFGPLWVDQGQHLELCSSYLTAGTLVQAVHFRNLTTGETTAPVFITIQSGDGACATYKGKGLVVGMARADSPASASEWLSLSNALIGTMSIVDNTRGDTHDDDHGDNGREQKGRNTRVAVAGIAKFWQTGL